MGRGLYWSPFWYLLLLRSGEAVVVAGGLASTRFGGCWTRSCMWRGKVVSASVAGEFSARLSCHQPFRAWRDSGPWKRINADGGYQGKLLDWAAETLGIRLNLIQEPCLKASRCCPNAGSSNAPSPSWDGTDASAKTTNSTQHPQSASSSSPQPWSCSDVSRVFRQALR